MSPSSRTPVPVTNSYTSNPLVTFDSLIDGAERATKLPDLDLPFGQALSWLSKAEEVGIDLGEIHVHVVANAYIDLILVALTRSQTLLLNCGHILRQHRDLTIAIESALHRLAGLRRHFNMASTLPCEILDAQGYAEELAKRVKLHVEHSALYTDADQFDFVLSHQSHIRSLILPLTAKVASDFRSDKTTLGLIGTAASNASYSIFRFLKVLSDYKKAAKMCDWAERTLRDVDNKASFVLSQVDRAHLSRSLRLATDALNKQKFVESKNHLRQVEKLLRRLNAEF